MSRVIDRALTAALDAPSVLRWAAVVAWAAMIFVASDQQGLAISEDPGVDRPFRHTAHVVVYAGLAALLVWALAGRRLPSPGRAVAGGVLAVLYGVTDEWHQTMVPTRTGRPEDLVWDAIGATLAVVGVLAVAGWARRSGARGG